MVVEEFHDQKIIYHLNIDEEVNNILMHLSSLKTIKTNRVIKGTTLVGAFYIFSLAFYSYLFHILFAWIFLLLSIGFAAIGLSVEKLQKVFMRAIINKETINEQISNFAQTYPTNLKASSNEALLFMRRYRFANCSCFSCCFKDAYPSSNVQ